MSAVDNLVPLFKPTIVAMLFVVGTGISFAVAVKIKITWDSIRQQYKELSTVSEKRVFRKIAIFYSVMILLNITGFIVLIGAVGRALFNER